MSLPTKELLGLVSVILTFACYAPYFRILIRNDLHPHLFSWIIWGAANGIIFLGQYAAGGGAGSWLAATTALLCFVIAILSFFKGEKNITKSDWIAFLLTIATLPLWYFTHNPLGAIILATLIDIGGCYPTVRKSWHKPYSEPLFAWNVAALRSFISFFALSHYSAVTVIFPIAMTLTNCTVAGILIWRRRHLKAYEKMLALMPENRAYTPHPL